MRLRKWQHAGRYTKTKMTCRYLRYNEREHITVLTVYLTKNRRCYGLRSRYMVSKE